MIRNWVKAELVSGLEQLLRENFAVSFLELQKVINFDFNLLSEPSNMIPLEIGVNVLEACAKYTKCEDLGLELVDRQSNEILGLLGYIGEYASDFETAIKHMFENMSLNVTGVDWQLTKGTGYVEMVFNLDVEENIPHKQTVLVGMGQLYNYNKYITRNQWSPSRVYFKFPAPSNLRRLKQSFGPNLYFNMEFNGFVFSQKQLALPIANANQRMSDLLNDYMRLTGQTSQVDKLSQIKLSIRSLLILQQSCSLNEIAASQNKTPRAIQYYLKKFGQSYQELLDDVRYQLACDLLVGSEQSISAVSALVGFNDSTVFSRSFKKYKGLTPSQYRLQALNQR